MSHSTTFACTVVLLSILSVVTGAKSRLTDAQKSKIDEANDIHLFMALVDPLEPVAVTIPLSWEQEVQFLASREGLIARVHELKKDYDLREDHHKSTLREKTARNTDRTTELLIKAVKEGKTLQEARVGIALAQFQAMGDAERQAAEERARKRFTQMPEGQREKLRARMEEVNHKERAELEALASSEDIESFVRQRYKPSTRIPSELK